ncbi:MAG: response regulator, partial [Proteobacteria bacterium]
MTEPPLQSRIAIVDDDTMVAASLAALLERAGYVVERFSSPEDALGYLVHESFDAVVSDVSMPTMTGLDMLARMRERRHDLPVIFITGAPRLEDTMRAMELGAFRYLSKPIQRDQLLK